MRRLTLLIIAVLSAPAMGAPAAKPKAGTIEATLQGEWVAVEWEEKGDPVSLRSLKQDMETAVIADSSIKFSESDAGPESYEFSVARHDGGGNLYIFDLHRGTEKRNHALIQLLDQDTFVLVVHSRFKPNKPEDRPTSISSKNNEEKDPEGLWNPLLFKFKRVPKGKKPIDIIEAYHKDLEKK